ncbi:class I SAM-dependent methyltransferase [Chiayiivirga flava]|uniref:SAM-dependent methyltransferase n=1 Tax=Chiayiivirga flava TaxID=659595 RepID=A0A7W8FZB3_9GAMM|nr:class I SAM-dependent methyltransferase [Chiayiivirga flava]MBB5207966.1 SAM-dependent methyltransferase [Chiayiivirga flava]
MTRTFKDHFSGHAATYARARPTYPDALFDWLAGVPARRGLAWDAGCGNGQATVALARVFERVLGTDPSAEQIAQAAPAGNVEYRVEPAEAPTLADGSVDLVTVAQALHWFDLPAFYAQVRRVLADDGAIAVWSYGLSQVSRDVDAAFMRLYDQWLGNYWPPERRHIENGYAELEFPFARVDGVPAFEMAVTWTLGQYLAYLGTWSATQRYKAATGVDPIERIAPEFAAAWGEADTRVVRWPLVLRVGRQA